MLALETWGGVELTAYGRELEGQNRVADGVTHEYRETLRRLSAPQSVEDPVWLMETTIYVFL